MAYVAPSITTFSGVNPGYRIYSVDCNHSRSTYQVLDYDNFYVDLEEANLAPLGEVPRFWPILEVLVLRPYYIVYCITLICLAIRLLGQYSILKYAVHIMHNR